MPKTCLRPKTVQVNKFNMRRRKTLKKKLIMNLQLFGLGQVSRPFLDADGGDGNGSAGLCIANVFGAQHRTYERGSAIGRSGGSAGADAGAGARFGCWTVVSLCGYVCCCFGHHGGGY